MLFTIWWRQWIWWHSFLHLDKFDEVPGKAHRAVGFKLEQEAGPVTEVSSGDAAWVAGTNRGYFSVFTHIVTYKNTHILLY